ncbi:hypothetical protein [Nostoc sp. T09]|uniref:hypothetical protein n=1 Tax=Nostoc sp. T09 TaxID=1932621 RepID=UPI001C4E5690|nr:hypothetical protein [Nostoc sp. T09]
MMDTIFNLYIKLPLVYRINVGEFVVTSGVRNPALAPSYYDAIKYTAQLILVVVLELAIASLLICNCCHSVWTNGLVNSVASGKSMFQPGRTVNTYTRSRADSASVCSVPRWVCSLH